VTTDRPHITCIEAFLTPRMGAEAARWRLVAAAFSGRKFWCLVLLAAAVVLHPVMAAAGIIVYSRSMWRCRVRAGTITGGTGGTGGYLAARRRLCHADWPVGPTRRDWLALVSHAAPIYSYRIGNSTIGAAPPSY